ncbi:MAG: hypothetical protein JHD16_04345 [Solirubrobacteraceae bacterium]|nr:hypothetical protein [Solirubrobacteraceae bacterium]
MTRLQTAIWHEEAEPTDAFAVRRARLHGYDVTGDLLGRASWGEMLLLLFTGQRPTAQAAALLTDLAVAVANPGPRDPSVHSAMAAGVSGAPAAAVLMAALSAGAGQGGGGRDVLLAMQLHASCGDDLTAWSGAIQAPGTERDDAWPTMEHPPGFEPHAAQRATTVDQTLAALARRAPGGRLTWLQAHADELEAMAGRPLSMAGVAAAALLDLGLAPEQGEMVYLLLRLPGAAAHALEQAQLGFKAFPFPELDLLDDPERPAALAGQEA